MGVTTYVTIDPASSVNEEAYEALSKRKSGQVSVVWGTVILYNQQDGYGWYHPTNAFDLTQAPDSRFSADSEVKGHLVQILRNDAPVGPADAWQGYYTGQGEFDGCEAEVKNIVRIDSGAVYQSVRVFGPYATAHSYFYAVSQRQVQPDDGQWLEPKPRFLRLRRFLGLV